MTWSPSRTEIFARLWIKQRKNCMSKKLKPFWDYVEKTNDCWLWLGPISDGYGFYGEVRAYRVAWFLSKGVKIRDGYEPHHKCENKACVRPDHLEELTRQEHMRYHAPHANHIKKTHCPYGHPYSEENTYISPEGKKSCRACRAKYSRGVRRNRS